MLKGGPGSGNFGHRGRIGKHGGSISGGGLLSKGPKLTLGYEHPITKNKPTTDKKKIILSRYARALENFTDPSGLKIKITSISSSVVQGIILDSKGNKVGDIKRKFDFTQKTVHHSYLSLDDQAQKSGFGSRFYYASERLYPSMGFNKVSIEANKDVGGYAWARMGYDFSEDTTRSNYKKFLEVRYQKKFNTPIPFVPEKAYEIAAFKGPNGERIGKDILMGQRYTAIKSLDPKDEGYQAGLDYYKEKGVI